ncbi:helix-turn-helix domain-containing protein [Sinorhizobium meliloti]|uniref:Transcriptional regulator n=1 Tax=Rhizobium meliloti TaxID=382 RepID=A0A2J0YX35_RHIML|nr:helix-turn-helix transcriptional regulator [Sinorhizobium meliloti]PJR12829.1 transcriptional regulator [Sinorhizobium meliloti]
MLSINPEKRPKGQPNPVDVHVGRRIRMRRGWMDMSQQALAEAIGVTFQQVQKYEKGRNRVGASRLQQIAEALEVQPSYFFDGMPEEAPSREKAGEQKDHLNVPVEVLEFITSPEGLQLIRSFSKIGDLKVRERILMLVKSLGEHDW